MLVSLGAFDSSIRDVSYHGLHASEVNSQESNVLIVLYSLTAAGFIQTDVFSISLPLFLDCAPCGVMIHNDILILLDCLHG